MSTQISRDRIRIAAAGLTGAPTDRLTSSQPTAFPGNDLQVEVARFATSGSGAVLADITNIATLTMDVKSFDSRLSLPVMSKTLSSGELNAALTPDEWASDAPDKSHALFVWTKEETNVVLDADQQDFWFVVYGYTSDTPTRKVTWCVGTITLFQDGSSVPPPDFVLQPTYLTIEQADARYTVSATKLNISGGTMTGLVSFSGTTHAGLRLNNLTTTQRTALTGAAGLMPFDTTAHLPYFHDGTSWRTFVTSINGSTGDVTLTTAGVAEVTNLYFTTARTLGTALTGLSTSSAASVTSTDTVLQAIGKLQARTAASGGSVTSVAMTVPSFLNVANSPITGAGTLAVTLANATANFVLAGPTSGGSVAPAFRALVAADIPAIPESGVTNLTTDLAAKASLSGATMTGALNLVAGTPTGNNAASRTFNDATYLALAGGTVTGGLTVNASFVVAGSGSATWSTAPTAAGHLVNKTYADLKLAIAGGTLTGLIGFSGTTHAGIRLNNLTDAQRTALSSPAAGMVVFNTTTSQPMFYSGSAWVNFSTSGGTVWLNGTASPPSNGIGNDGNYYVDTNSFDVYLKTSGAWALAGPRKLSLAGGIMSGAISFASNLGVGLDFSSGILIQAETLNTELHFYQAGNRCMKIDATCHLVFTDGPWASAYYDPTGVQIIGGYQGAAIPDATDLATALTAINSLLGFFRGWGTIAP